MTDVHAPLCRDGDPGREVSRCTARGGRGSGRGSVVQDRMCACACGGGVGQVHWARLLPGGTLFVLGQSVSFWLCSRCEVSSGCRGGRARWLRF